MIAARKGSPLAIGHGTGEMFVGSDAIALAPMTDRMTYLEEGDRAEVTRAGAEIYDAAGRRANRAKPASIDSTRIEKAATSISWPRKSPNSPSCWPMRCAITLGPVAIRLNLPQAMTLQGVSRLVLVACGTANLACQVAKYWFEQIAGPAGRGRYRLGIPLPRSGDRPGILGPCSSASRARPPIRWPRLRHVQDKVAKVVSVVNVPTSSIARESDLALPILAGVEVGVASTKAFTNQLLTLLALLALKAGVDRGRL
jgi:glutamine---fructose-6-phosphate transaminase (isomerizing)